jgi:hypothetical protein
MGLASFCVMSQGQSTTSDTKLRQIMGRAQAGANGSDPATSAAYQPPKTLAPEHATLRNTLLRDAEAALSRRDVIEAEVLFDKAANIQHAADTEIGLVRTYMQAGAYRRALAFGAHTAGVHLDVVGGSALYAWLLQMGGQQAIAQRLLNDTLARQPDSAFMLAVAKQLRSERPLADTSLQIPPTRLAPYGDNTGLPKHARVAGSAVLLSDGRQALAPLVLIPASDRVLVRNGLGQLSQARILRRHAGLGVAVLTLEQALPVAGALQSHTGPVFPGSAGYAIEYVANATADAAWPMMSIGFIGAPSGTGKQLTLGIALKDGSGGGPVFDASGRLLGMAVSRNPQRPLDLVSVQDLQTVLGKPLAPPAPSGVAARAVLDQMYEAGLLTGLQLITVAKEGP